MADTRQHPCPVCKVRLRREEHGAYSPRLCPAGHGLLVDDMEMRRIVAASTISRLRELADDAATATGDCPVCLQPLHGVEIQRVAASGCAVCGSIWFPQDAVAGHVREVRRREWGASSFAARDDVERLGANLQPAEVVAGLLAYYELEPTGAPKSA